MGSINNNSKNVNIDNFLGVVLAIICYLGTTVFFSNILFVACIFPILIHALYTNAKVKFDKNVLIIVAICILSLANRIFFIENFQKISDLLPYTFLIIITYIIAKHSNEMFLYVIIILVSLEGFVALYEYLNNVTSIFNDVNGFEKFNPQNTLLYDKRVFGLSANSSGLASKNFWAILLLYQLPIVGKKRIILETWLIIMLLFTFNRTTVLSITVFYTLNFLYKYLKIIPKANLLLTTKNGIKLILIPLLLSLIFSYVAIKYEKKIVEQFTRNSGKVEMSGREKIWPKFSQFIGSNLLFGNGSYKYEVPYDGHFDNNGNIIKVHAHNSFLQLIANNGIIISVLFFLLIIVNLSLSNIILVLAILIASVTQYEIFWGISLGDILFMKILTDRRIEPKEIKT